MYEADGEPVDEATIKLWHAGEGDAKDHATYLPNGATTTTIVAAGGAGGGSGGDVNHHPVVNPITDAEIAKLRTSCNPFIEWLNSAEEDDDDEEDEEED